MLRNSRGLGVTFSRDVEVITNRVRTNRAEGIGVEDSQRVVVRDNVMTGNAGGIAALDLPEGRPLDSVTITTRRVVGR